MLFSLEGARARPRGVADTEIKRKRADQKARGGNAKTSSNLKKRKKQKEKIGERASQLLNSLSLSLHRSQPTPTLFSPASSRWGARREAPAAPTRPRPARRPRGDDAGAKAPPTTAPSKRQRRRCGALSPLLLRGATPPKSCCSRCGSSCGSGCFLERRDGERERVSLEAKRTGKDFGEGQARFETSLGEF